MRRPLHLPERHGVSRVLGGAAVGHHLLRQLRPGHAHSLPVHHARGVDRHALLGTWTGSRTINSVYINVNLKNSNRVTSHQFSVITHHLDKNCFY